MAMLSGRSVSSSVKALRAQAEGGFPGRSHPVCMGITFSRHLHNANDKDLLWVASSRWQGTASKGKVAAKRKAAVLAYLNLNLHALIRNMR